MRTIDNKTDLESLAARFRRLEPTARARWGRMNPQQMALHVADVSAMVLKQKPGVSIKRKVPPAVAKFVVFKVLRTIPRNVRTSANPATWTVDRAAFTSDVERAIASLQELGKATADQLAENHPAMGKLSRTEWLQWAHMHADHHLKQFGV